MVHVGLTQFIWDMFGSSALMMHVILAVVLYWCISKIRVIYGEFSLIVTCFDASSLNATCNGFFLIIICSPLLTWWLNADEMSGDSDRYILYLLQLLAVSIVQQPEYVNELSSNYRQSLRVRPFNSPAPISPPPPPPPPPPPLPPPPPPPAPPPLL